MRSSSRLRRCENSSNPAPAKPLGDPKAQALGPERGLVHPSAHSQKTHGVAKTAYDGTTRLLTRVPAAMATLSGVSGVSSMNLRGEAETRADAWVG